MKKLTLAMILVILSIGNLLAQDVASIEVETINCLESNPRSLFEGGNSFSITSGGSQGTIGIFKNYDPYGDCGTGLGAKITTLKDNCASYFDIIQISTMSHGVAHGAKNNEDHSNTSIHNGYAYGYAYGWGLGYGYSYTRHMQIIYRCLP